METNCVSILGLQLNTRFENDLYRKKEKYTVEISEVLKTDLLFISMHFMDHYLS